MDSSSFFAFQRKKAVRFPSSLLIGKRTKPWEAAHVPFLHVLLCVVAFWPEEPASVIGPQRQPRIPPAVGSFRFRT
jgi:hypothetical protein